MRNTSSMSFMNAKRVRDYPRLMLITTYIILGINLLLHNGWISGFGQVIAGDFVMFYSTGIIYRTSPELIYDYDKQSRTQQSLVAPTTLTGYNPYMNPPYVAPFYSILTHIPLEWSLLLWTILAIGSIFLVMRLLFTLVPVEKQSPELGYSQLVVIGLSFFPFIEGIQAGQNHWITLLLVTGITYAMYKEKWVTTGILTGLLIYKPQFTIGFIILWLIWRKSKALLAFTAVTTIWIGAFILQNGIKLLLLYSQLSQVFMDLPYIAGFPNYLLVTIYGLLTSIFPKDLQSIITFLTYFIIIIGAIGLGWFANRQKGYPMVERIPTIVGALLLPLLATPYALVHDMIILLPAYVMWGIYSNTNRYINISATVYLGVFILTFIASVTGIAWVSLITFGLFIALTTWIFNKNNSNTLMN